MKTDELIDLLAARVEPVPRTSAGILVLRWAVPGLLGALLIMLVLYGLRPDFA